MSKACSFSGAPVPIQVTLHHGKPVSPTAAECPECGAIRQVLWHQACPAFPHHSALQTRPKARARYRLLGDDEDAWCWCGSDGQPLEAGPGRS